MVVIFVLFHLDCLQNYSMLLGHYHHLLIILKGGFILPLILTVLVLFIWLECLRFLRKNRSKV